MFLFLRFQLFFISSFAFFLFSVFFRRLEVEIEFWVCCFCCCSILDKNHMILLTLLINFFRCFFLFFFRNNKKGNLFGVIFNCWNCVFRFVSFVVVGVVVFIVGRYLGLVFVSLLYFTPDQTNNGWTHTEKIEIQMGKTLTKQTNERTNNQRQSPKPDSKQSGALLLLNFTLERVWRNTLTQNKNQLLSISSFLLLLAVFDLSKYNKTSDTCCSKTKRRKNNRHTNKK